MVSNGDTTKEPENFTTRDPGVEREGLSHTHSRQQLGEGLLSTAQEYKNRAHKFVELAKQYALTTPLECNQVLVVEDNPRNGDLLKRLLEEEGFQCHVAPTAADALDWCRVHRPRMILMDIDLPDSNGIALTRKLKELPEIEKVPVIAVTAHVSNDIMMQAMEAGCESFVSKPYTARYLMNTVNKHM